MNGTLFQAKCWARHPTGCSFGYLWLRKLAKEMAKELKGILAHLFTKIMELGGKGGERSQVACEEENEENNGNRIK